MPTHEHITRTCNSNSTVLLLVNWAPNVLQAFLCVKFVQGQQFVYDRSLERDGGERDFFYKCIS